MNEQQLHKIENDDGFIAALDQSGGSTPKALLAYGVGEDAYSNDDEMFDTMHAMRSRIVTCPAFGGDRIMGAILFENTMDREIEGRAPPRTCGKTRGRAVPEGRQGPRRRADDAQVMKPMPDLDALLERAVDKGVFGTKMRSVIKLANPAGVDAVVDQQFEVGKQILAAGLMPIIEPEIDIHSPRRPRPRRC